MGSITIFEIFGVIGSAILAFFISFGAFRGRAGPAFVISVIVPVLLLIINQRVWAQTKMGIAEHVTCWFSPTSEACSEIVQAQTTTDYPKTEPTVREMSRDPKAERDNSRLEETVVQSKEPPADTQEPPAADTQREISTPPPSAVVRRRAMVGVEGGPITLDSTGATQLGQAALKNVHVDQSDSRILRVDLLLMPVSQPVQVFLLPKIDGPIVLDGQPPFGWFLESPANCKIQPDSVSGVPVFTGRDEINSRRAPQLIQGQWSAFPVYFQCEGPLQAGDTIRLQGRVYFQYGLEYKGITFTGPMMRLTEM